MQIIINNCNNIDEAKIQIHEDKLNIKYGINGTGKSTIVKAIELATNTIEGGDLSELTPFKYLEKEGGGKGKPCIDGLESVSSVCIFNEQYVDQFVFKQNEVVNNSFEIFIKTKEFDKKMEKIDDLISDIKETFRNNEHLEEVIKDLTELSDSFGRSKSGYSAGGRIGKAVGKGNKVENIPENLKPFAPFLRISENVRWIKWHIDGNDFLEVANYCPYCTSSTKEKREKILAVSKEYDHKSIEHLNKLLEILKRLGQYFEL
ncbi:hypothetical protein [Candidatus Nitrospira salsa]